MLNLFRKAIHPQKVQFYRHSLNQSALFLHFSKLIARVTVFPLLAFHVCFLWTMSPKPRLRSNSRVSYFRLWFKDGFGSCFYKTYVCLPIFFPSFLIIKMRGLWFFLHVSISGAVNNIKIICSIRFSLLITIDRFYKLFSCRECFRESSTWNDSPALS